MNAEIDELLNRLIDKNTSDDYEYGEHRPVNSHQLAQDVAQAVAKRCAEICISNHGEFGPVHYTMGVRDGALGCHNMILAAFGIDGAAGDKEGA